MGKEVCMNCLGEGQVVKRGGYQKQCFYCKGIGYFHKPELQSSYYLAGRPVLAVDFDRTLCFSHYPALGEPNHKVVEAVKKRKELGWIVILWTCRHGEDLVVAEEWCKQYGLQFDAVNKNCKEIDDMFGGNSGNKIYADEYWDDKAVHVDHIKGHEPCL